jgi:hypothetical protein
VAAACQSRLKVEHPQSPSKAANATTRTNLSRHA